MNNPEIAYNFLNAHPDEWFCDDCLGKATGIDRHEVNTIAWTLALFPEEFKRASTSCGQLCSERFKMSTQAVRNSR